MDAAAGEGDAGEQFVSGELGRKIHHLAGWETGETLWG